MNRNKRPQKKVQSSSRTLSMDHPYLSYAILEHLKSNHTGEDMDNAIELLSKSLGVDVETDAEAYKANKSLLEIFEAGKKSLKVITGSKDPVEDTDTFKRYLEKVTEKGFFKGVEPKSSEYKERYGKLLSKYKEKFAVPEAETTDNVALGDEFKAEGNEWIQKREYAKAVASYTEAINACPTGDSTYIYYCNRAAAHLYLQNNEQAYEDCAITVGLNPSYPKGHARLAQAAMNLGNEEEAEESANKALELEPGNAVAKTILAKLNSKSMAPAASGNPMADLMKGMDPSMLAGLGGGGGGMPDIGGMMNNPGMMEMAQKMMQDPNAMAMAQKMMQDPNAMADMMKMMGGKK